MDVNCKCYLEKGTLDHKIVRDTEVLLIDEFSMLEFNVFHTMDKITREALILKNRRFPFAGKHVISLVTLLNFQPLIKIFMTVGCGKILTS